MIVFRQGDDAKLALLITEDPAIDFSTAEEIVITLFVGTEEQKKYSLNARTGYGQVDVEEAPDTNKLNVFVERDHSIDFHVGTIKAYILARFPNLEFPDGNEVRSWSLVAGRVSAGSVLDETI